MLVYHWKEHDVKVTFTDGTDLHPAVELALGREVRTMQLEEFTDFLLTIIEEGRKSATAYVESCGHFRQNEVQDFICSRFSRKTNIAARQKGGDKT